MQLFLRVLEPNIPHIRDGKCVSYTHELYLSKISEEYELPPEIWEIIMNELVEPVIRYKVSENGPEQFKIDYWTFQNLNLRYNLFEWKLCTDIDISYHTFHIPEITLHETHNKVIRLDHFTRIGSILGFKIPQGSTNISIQANGNHIVRSDELETFIFDGEMYYYNKTNFPLKARSLFYTQLDIKYVYQNMGYYNENIQYLYVVEENTDSIMFTTPEHYYDNGIINRQSTPDHPIYEYIEKIERCLT